jgi:hypothetical protein
VAPFILERLHDIIFQLHSARTSVQLYHCQPASLSLTVHFGSPYVEKFTTQVLSLHKESNFPHIQTVMFYARLLVCCTMNAPSEKRRRHLAVKLVRAVVPPWKKLQMAHRWPVCISGYVPNAGMLCMLICNQIRTGKINERATQDGWPFSYCPQH